MATEQDEIWSHATAEQTENVPETPVEAPEEAKPERARDEKGKFVSKAPEPTSEEAPVEAPEETQAPVEETAPKEESDARVPSWRLAEEAERRRNAEQALNELRNEMRQIQMQMMSQQRQPEQQPQELPDIFADPQGFLSAMEQRQQQQIKTLQLENSLRFAHYSHGDKFNEAYQDFTDYVAKSKDQATYQRVMASADPGEALVQWYNDQQLQKELGGTDLNSFLERKREEWLKDPAIQAKVIEDFKRSQQAQPSNTVTQLPPSLSKASAARSAHDNTGSSPQDIWAYATKK